MRLPRDRVPHHKRPLSGLPQAHGDGGQGGRRALCLRLRPQGTAEQIPRAQEKGGSRSLQAGCERLLKKAAEGGPGAFEQCFRGGF